MARLRVLITEDHAATRRVLEKMFTRRGYEILVAANGEEALAIADTSRIDIMICDIGMPDMDGWTLLRRMRKTRPTLPAIAVTGYGREEEVEMSSRAGFDEHLSKPVTMEEIDAAIDRVMAKN